VVVDEAVPSARSAVEQPAGRSRAGAKKEALRGDSSAQRVGVRRLLFAVCFSALPLPLPYLNTTGHRSSNKKQEARRPYCSTLYFLSFLAPYELPDLLAPAQQQLQALLRANGKRKGKGKGPPGGASATKPKTKDQRACGAGKTQKQIL
jgi:hypothetical protein